MNVDVNLPTIPVIYGRVGILWFNATSTEKVFLVVYVTGCGMMTGTDDREMLPVNIAV